MYLHTPSASTLVLARTRLWTEKPVCRQAKILSPLSGFLVSH